MSSSSVCQGLQSCLEPCVMEPRVLSLKLALQQGSNFPQPSPITDNNTNTNSVSLSSLSASLEKPLTNHECDQGHTEPKEGRGWSILQTLSQSSDCHNKTEDSVYVHPTVKRSSSILSDKSLEMCTESLGSETGSNAGDSTDDVSLFSFDATIYTTLTTTTTTTDVTTTVANCESKRVNRACNFPPPLTTITDLGGVQVRPRREGGRLILEAVASPSPCPYFRVEREDGRLRLCLFEKFSDSEDEVCDVEEGVEEKEEEENENEKSREECGAEDSGAEECVENVDEEMGVTKFSRPSSCKESGKREIFCDGLASLNFPLFLSVSE
ncbi:protein FANTASTIC FOUR 2 [Vigna radiata var. radiata]|uniref:Protein FANTASTIC FOUR 2 n=1 Tax=Vigna radiata var. radiata TaxID=3916 RepID=A0A1S3TMF4_VIGRR|nr:protein FANTASTIC FOUR 2 [Vigna radiata var. radiata]